MSIATARLTTGKPVSGLATTFFTLGYEQSEPEEFLRRLQANGVEMVVDVRDIPLSRKRGFSKIQLQELLARVDIEYLHVRALGAPKQIRYPLRAGGSWWEYVKGYSRVLRARTAEIDTLIRLSREKRICLLCLERNDVPVQVEHIRY
jgi:Domain of unknown function DUF488